MSDINTENWLERARQMVAQQTEALEFIARVRLQLAQAQRRHAAAVATLWATANGLDQQIASLLDEMNRGLLEGKGQQDATRGAGFGPLGHQQDAFYYTCAWTLQWGDGLGIAIELALHPEEDRLYLHVAGQRSQESFPVPYPLTELDALRAALVNAFVAEAIADSFPEVEDAPAPSPATSSSTSKYRTEASEFMDQFHRMLSQQEDQPPSP